jgi:hypothetical protein
VSALVTQLAAGARECFGDGLVGIYLRGSLPLQAFDPETSDIDFLVVTRRPISESEFARLEALHRKIAATPNPYARRLEGSYIDAQALRRFRPHERRHPSIGVDWPLQWQEHRDNWVIERWLLRKHAMTLVGPVPGTLIDPISADDLTLAVRGELARRIDDWAGGAPAPAWLIPRNYQAFEIETMCRALFTLSRGEVCSKPQAVQWALERLLPERWDALVRASQSWRADKRAAIEGVADVQAFVGWVATEGESWAATPGDVGQ